MSNIHSIDIRIAKMFAYVMHLTIKVWPWSQRPLSSILKFCFMVHMANFSYIF